jgi:hypothetical protein
VRFGPERERRADRRGHLLDRKSESAACLLIARGSHDRQGGGHSRFARAELALALPKEKWSIIVTTA